MTLLATTTTTAPAEDDDAEVVEQRDRLLARLAAQRVRARELWAWYAGEQPPPVTQTKYRDVYRLLLDIARTPWARLVVDAVSERLHVEGFRADPQADGDAFWTSFKRSRMTADEWLVYTEALIVGVGYVSVDLDDDDELRLAPESAYEVTHEAEPGNRRRVAAALKMYPLDWTGRSWACDLYRPDATYRWAATTPAAKAVTEGQFPIDKAATRKVAWEDEGTDANPGGVVPVVPFENRASILGGGRSELEDCLPILRRIDKLTLDKLLTSEYGAFRQRWATGLEVPRDPDTGKPVEPYAAAVNRLWVSEDPDTKFGSFDATDLGPYLSAIDAEIAALAAITRVPSHYLVQQSLANPPSAESLLAGETGLVSKVEERQRRFGEAWEQVAVVGAALAEAADTPEVETVWADAEMRNPAQVADAAVKLAQVGVPQQALWEWIGASPDDIARWSQMAVADELLALLTAPTAPAPAPTAAETAAPVAPAAPF